MQKPCLPETQKKENWISGITWLAWLEHLFALRNKLRGELHLREGLSWWRKNLKSKRKILKLAFHASFNTDAMQKQYSAGKKQIVRFIFKDLINLPSR